jgi:hypothetical protein
MAHTQDYIPSRDAEFDGWFENFNNYIAARTSGQTPPAWTHIPAEKTAALADHFAAWHAAYDKTLGPHTEVDTKAKNDRRAEAEHCVRPFVQQYLKFDPVTDEDRIAARVHNHDSTHTTIGAPAGRPVIAGLKALGGFQALIPFHDEHSPESRAIPYGCNGCLLYYAIGPAPIADYALLKETVLMTHSPFTLHLSPEAEGKYLSSAARWQNEKGELGPWSDIEHTVIA